VPDPEDKLRYVMDAVRLIRRELHGSVPLIGFAGSPWTLATYMVEGSGSKEFARIKKLMFDEPALAHQLLATTARAVTLYLNAQIAAGAQAIMLFDTWGGVLTARDYREFSLRYMQDVLNGLTRDAQGSASAAGGRMPGAAEADGRKVPVILFTKGGGPWLESIAASGCDAVGLDWTCDLGMARQRVGARVALQGNMDPSVLYASPTRIRSEVEAILASYGSGSGHVFNLGHGIHTGINPDHVAVLVEAVHELSRPYHTP
jgi:uroporphyrinogen decarboxylase